MCDHRASGVIHTIIDSCGWVAVVDAGINIDTELKRCVGSERMAILPKVMHELEELEKRNNTKLLLGILRQRNTDFEQEDGHTDLQIRELAEKTGWPTLTVDKRLKAKLLASNLPVIEVVAAKRLNLIE